jgi:flagella basal body P-ring formation protein FlgA
MPQRSLLHSVLFVWALAFAVGPASAGEIRLHPQAVARTSVVHLGDVSEITGFAPEKAARLKSLPLFPAPQATETRRLTAQDVREVFSLYGLATTDVLVVGECLVSAGTRSAQADSGDAALVRNTALQVNGTGSESPPQLPAGEELVAAMSAYLTTKDRVPTEWRVKPLLSAEQRATIEAMQWPEVSGGQAPWTGRQVFRVRDAADASSEGVPFKADVARVARAVIASRALAAGDVISEADVELAEVNPLSLNNTAIVSVSEVIGQEVRRAIPAGQLIANSSVRRPIAIKRGDLVTVYSIAAGVQVKTSAKSLAEGALGDVVLLQGDRPENKFQARITGYQEAMVFVDTPRVASESSANPDRKDPQQR